MLLRLCCAGLIVMSCSSAWAVDITLDFEGLPLASGFEYENGKHLSVPGEFTHQGATFNNYYDETFGPYWEGWAYSTKTDATTPGFGNQYSAFTGGGANGSTGYGVGFTDGFVLPASIITLPDGYQPKSMMVTNTTYAAFIMLDGDPNNFSKKYGFGDDRSTEDIAETDQPDWFRLQITGLDDNDQQTGIVDFYLADYRFDSDAQDYVIDEWVNLDLTSLGAATKLSFELFSSDFGSFGLNTPAYFAMDNLVLQVPEPATVLLAAVAACSFWMTAKSRKKFAAC